MEGPITFKHLTEMITSSTPLMAGVTSRATPDGQCLRCLPSNVSTLKRRRYNHRTFTDKAMLFAIYMTANIIQKCKQSVLSVVKWDVFISKIWKFFDQKELWIDTFRFSNLWITMSEVLGRTWALLMSSGTGPRWTVPSNQVSRILTDFYNMSP